jgi:hypothetical protein
MLCARNDKDIADKIVEALCRALYVAVNNSRLKGFTRIRDELRMRYSDLSSPPLSFNCKISLDSNRNTPKKVNSQAPNCIINTPIAHNNSLNTNSHVSNVETDSWDLHLNDVRNVSTTGYTERTENVGKVMKCIRLLGNDIPYFADRDGQCFMHYLAKDKHTSAFEDMVKSHYNPMIRDRLGRMAWDLANSSNVIERLNYDLLQQYVREAYTSSTARITVIPLADEKDPNEEDRVAPVAFFSEGESELKKRLQEAKTKNKPTWIHVDINDVSTILKHQWTGKSLINDRTHYLL